MKPADAVVMERIHTTTRLSRIRLKDWESIKLVKFGDDLIQVAIETYEVKVLVREDRFLKKGTRILFYKQSPDKSHWDVDFDQTVWDEDFEPFVYYKVAHKSAQEELDQREWEKLCYRPGTARRPLDNYERVRNDPSTPAMERFW